MRIASIASITGALTPSTETYSHRSKVTVMRFAVLVLLLGCGTRMNANSVQAPRVDIAKELASHDASRISNILGASVIDGGFLFEDPACATKFDAARPIEPQRRNAFAQCLATLDLRPSQREHELGEVILLEYGAGYKVEARVADNKVTSVGFGSTFPIVTPRHLRALQSEQGNTPSLPPTLEPDAAAWIHVCVDSSGQVSTTTVMAMTSSLAAATFERSLRAGAFILSSCAANRDSFVRGCVSREEMHQYRK